MEAAATPAMMPPFPMKHTVDHDCVSLYRDPRQSGNALFQFHAAVARIVERAVAEDRAKRAAPPTGMSEDKVRRIACPECNGSGWVAKTDGIYENRCPLCHGNRVIRETTPAPEPEPAAVEPPEPVAPPVPSSMPAFPMMKEVTPDRLVLLREPREKGTAFEQFERALRGYIERHPVYRDCPCPTCSAGEDDDEGWEEDDGEDEDMVAGLRPEPEPSPRDRLRVAVARTLTDEDFIEAARMLRGSFRNADLSVLTFVLECLAGRDGGGR